MVTRKKPLDTSRSRLSALDVKNAGPGEHYDGGGLWLVVNAGRRRRDSTGKSYNDKNYKSRRWVYEYKLNGKRRKMGLGPYETVSLKKARQERDKWEKVKLDLIDPIEERDRQIQKFTLGKGETFEWCANRYIEVHEPEWRNLKHAQQWRTTLEEYAFPVFGKKPIEEINRNDVLRALEPYWKKRTKGGKPETMSRVRGRIELIMSWAIANKHRPQNAIQNEPPNPATWKDNLEHHLPKVRKLKEERKQPSLPYTEIQKFYAALDQQDSVASVALQLLILTGLRSKPVLQAEWKEIDFDKGAWNIPASKMKAENKHRVPLSKECLRLLKKMKELRSNKWVFPGAKNNTCLSSGAFDALLDRMQKRAEWLDPEDNRITTHGFRATITEYLDEETNIATKLKEAVLAHTLGEDSFAKYSRGDKYKKRALIMEDWANFCTSPVSNGDGKVIKLKSKRA